MYSYYFLFYYLDYAESKICNMNNWNVYSDVERPAVPITVWNFAYNYKVIREWKNYEK